ncbi:CLUMA_CG005521, isoform A [Clunio marinus]|uniref:CLUMA_CG005521, isoform A n=1 Tax=Clunio marinus TaxID=568069 RepID=A0A1J1HV55_9DIPT|nr:CLUMA_CG005521, isoform A [Clunio marinus]
MHDSFMLHPKHHFYPSIYEKLSRHLNYMGIHFINKPLIRYKYNFFLITCHLNIKSEKRFSNVRIKMNDEIRVRSGTDIFYHVLKEDEKEKDFDD